MRTLKILPMLGFIAVLTGPSWVAAEVSLGTVDIDHVSMGASDFLSVYGAGYWGTDFYSGVYMLYKTGGTDMGTLWPNGPVPSFCMELSQPYPTTPKTYDVINTDESYDFFLGECLGTAKAGYLEELWGRYYDSSWTGSGPFTSTQNTEAAAFAAAVWEIVHEDLPASPLLWNVDTDGSPGMAGFRAEGVNSILANSWLHSLDGSGPHAALAVFTHTCNQNYLVEVPEPATLVLLALGGAFGLARHRRKIRA